MADPDAWLSGELTLASQLHQEVDRRAAAQLSRDDLSILADRLIVEWYRHSAMLDSLLGKVRHLQVELALSRATPFPSEPTPEHYRWAKELGG